MRRQYMTELRYTTAEGPRAVVLPYWIAYRAAWQLVGRQLTDRVTLVRREDLPIVGDDDDGAIYPTLPRLEAFTVQVERVV